MIYNAPIVAEGDIFFAQDDLPASLCPERPLGMKGSYD